MPPAHHWARAPRDALPVALALALSPLIAATAPEVEEPLARMRGLIEAERALGLFFEPAVYRWVAARPPVMGALEVTYVGAHLPVALGVLAWVWRARPHAFSLARNTFVCTQTLAMIGAAVAPTAPPRMVPGLGYDRRPGPGDHGLGRLVQSPYAAMPSAHAAFALVAAGTVWSLTQSTAVRMAALAYPPAVVVEVIATGNHVWLDAVGGLVIAGLGVATACAVQHARSSRQRSRRNTGRAWATCSRRAARIVGWP
ncbi:MAG: hypothetical protein V7644_1365 [Actinomycetota bacterium]|jgi:hypothetical protein